VPASRGQQPGSGATAVSLSHNDSPEKARDDFGETVGTALDALSALPLIPAPVRAVIRAVRDTVVSVARTVWNFFF
jgi:predicted GTPase